MLGKEVALIANDRDMYIQQCRSIDSPELEEERNAYSKNLVSCVMAVFRRDTLSRGQPLVQTLRLSSTSIA